MTTANDTKNFKITEFACKCGHFNCPHYAVKQELIEFIHNRIITLV